jgi:predicted ester cyclase
MQPWENTFDRFLDAYNRADWDALDALVTPGYVHHNNDLELDLAGFKRGAAWIRSGFPDFRIEVADRIAADDRLAVRVVGRGTHTGSLSGEVPTSKPVVVHGIVIYRFHGDLIAEDWEALDEEQFAKQLS